MFKKAALLIFFSLSIPIVYAQCTYSTGTPIINETFGAGQGFGGQLPAGVTNMQYVANECPNDGQYTITNYTSHCFSGAWHTVTDHTGDTNGYFMLVNASYQPSDFYVKPVDGLCVGTTYEFSAWIVNMNNNPQTILPNITFTIEKTDGTVLATYDTGDIPVTQTVTWKKYDFYFKTPNNISTVIIRMHNNAPGGNGNDLGIDDIGFSPAGPDININVPGTKNDTLYNLCFNKKITLSSVIGDCFTQNTYQWQSSNDGVTWTDIPGEINQSYTFMVQNTGTKLYRLNVAEAGNIGSVNCRVNSNIITVISNPPTIKNITANICTGMSYTLPSGKTADKTGTYNDTLRTTQGCDSLITNLKLTVNSPAYSTITSDICQGQTYAGYSKTGTYIDTLTAADGCDSIRTLNLTVNGVPEPNLGPDLNLCYGDTVMLSPGAFSSYLWQNNSTLPYFRVTKPGTYWVKVYNEYDCAAIDTVVVRMSNCKPIRIPNTFSPNNDGINDTWKIDALAVYDDCTVQIFNRYGNVVFYSKGLYLPWDGKINGKEAPTGTYYYIIDVPDIREKFTGWLLLVR